MATFSPTTWDALSAAVAALNADGSDVIELPASINASGATAGDIAVANGCTIQPISGVSSSTLTYATGKALSFSSGASDAAIDVSDVVFDANSETEHACAINGNAGDMTAVFRRCTAKNAGTAKSGFIADATGASRTVSAVLEYCSSTINDNDAYATHNTGSGTSTVTMTLRECTGVSSSSQDEVLSPHADDSGGGGSTINVWGGTYIGRIASGNGTTADGDTNITMHGVTLTVPALDTSTAGIQMAVASGGGDSKGVATLYDCTVNHQAAGDTVGCMSADYVAAAGDSTITCYNCAFNVSADATLIEPSGGVVTLWDCTCAYTASSPTARPWIDSNNDGHIHLYRCKIDMSGVVYGGSADLCNCRAGDEINLEGCLILYPQETGTNVFTGAQFSATANGSVKFCDFIGTDAGGGNPRGVELDGGGAALDVDVYGNIFNDLQRAIEEQAALADGEYTNNAASGYNVFNSCVQEVYNVGDATDVGPSGTAQKATDVAANPDFVNNTGLITGDYRIANGGGAAKFVDSAGDNSGYQIQAYDLDLLVSPGSVSYSPDLWGYNGTRDRYATTPAKVPEDGGANNAGAYAYGSATDGIDIQVTYDDNGFKRWDGEVPAADQRSNLVTLTMTRDRKVRGRWDGPRHLAFAF